MKFKVFSLAIAATTPLFVQAEDKHFVSVGYGAPSMAIEFEIQSYYYNRSGRETMNKDNQAFSGRYGIYSDNVRYYGQLDYASASAKDFDKKVTYTGLSANIDYVHRPHQDLGLFIGPHIQLGYADFYERREKGGIGFGLQFGGLAQLNNGVELELGYRHTKTMIEAKPGNKLVGMALKDISGIYATVGYRF